MKNFAKDIFYGKIILFGEYGIIFDSMALTIPFTHFHGELSFDNKLNKYKYTDYDFARNSNTQLESYSVYLRKKMDEGELPAGFDFNAFIRDLGNGLYFESSIPQGYGLGSSGALVAALYKRYYTSRIKVGKTTNSADIIRLKHIFATMESFFHGKSSGIDPLNSYFHYPLLIRTKNHIETVEIPRHKYKNNEGIFLINSGFPGKTEPVVKLFLDHCNDPNYFHVISNRYIPINNSCISSLIGGHMTEFFKSLNQLSALQFDYFSDMIPDRLKPVWKHGIESNLFNLKLCGSGGGGYLLGFTNNIDKAMIYFSGMQTEFITVYKGSDF
jgi:mevalonate kinase